MNNPTLEFWFEFASPYSYVAAMRIEGLCEAAGVSLRWRPFLLAPIFERQGWRTSPFNLNPLRGAYVWRDMERLAAKFGLRWKKPSAFPRKSVLAARIAAANSDAAWIGRYVEAIYVANFGDDVEIEDERVVSAAIRAAGADPEPVMQRSSEVPLRSRLRENTERAQSLGIFGAPNCVIGGEIFWGEEVLDDAIDWTLAQHARSPPDEDTHIPICRGDNPGSASFENRIR